MALTTSRNAPCPCGARKPNGDPVKYKQCCLAKDEAARKPHTGQDAVIVLMPTRGQICAETQMAIENNMRDVPHILVRQARKPIVEARNTLARFALQLRSENPFAFTPAEFFALWCDDDAWFPPGLPAMMLRCMRDCPDIDALFGWFGTRSPYGPPVAFRRFDDQQSVPRVGYDCQPGDLVPVEAGGFHFVMMRLSLLERIGENPFDLAGTNQACEDIAFCERATRIGAKMAVGTSFPVFHIDARDGMAYQPGMPPGMMEGNSVRVLTLDHAGAAGAPKTAESHSYGLPMEGDLAQRELAAAGQLQAELEQRQKVSDAA